MKKIKDLISIVIPVYNVEKYITECLQSVINQTYKNIEILIVNDGSTDKSLELCKAFNYDERIIIIDKENEGLSVSRQTGIDKAKGIYFCTIDSDDYLHESYIEKLYNSINEHDSDITVCESVFFRGLHRENIYLNKHLNLYQKITINDIKNKYYDLLRDYVMSDSWNKMYKMEFVRKSKVRFELSKKYNGTDLLYNHLLLLHKPAISIVREPIYYHRVDNLNSRVHRKNKKMYEGFNFIIKRLLNETKKLNLDEDIKLQLSKLYYRLQYSAFYDIYVENKLNLRQYSGYLKSNNEFVNKNTILITDGQVFKEKHLLVIQSAIQRKNIVKLLIRSWLVDIKGAVITKKTKCQNNI